MSVVSRACLTLFEVVNEMYVAVGAGFVGMAVLIHHGYKTNQLIRTLSVASVSLGSLLYVFHASATDRSTPSSKQIVFITGCDSGLGYSLTLHASELGFTVIAGFLSLESSGAREIRRLLRTNIKQIELDVTNNDSVFVAVEALKHFLDANPTYALHAVINNAGVMVFGEFEWQTERLIKQQLDVNIYGTIKISKAFIPLLRQHKGRLINVISHCSYACLPGLTVYGLTKAGVKSLSEGLRVELSKYGVKVITFTPGSFVTQSNIMAKHPEYVQEMHREFTDEQHEFYEDYFQRYNAHLLGLTPPKVPRKLDEQRIYESFEDALLNESPRPSYKVEPPRYAFYHVLFKITPVVVRDYLILKFMQMPEYNMSQNW